MNAEVHTLTGAYALDAVSETERIAFERHLADCATCRQEVFELRETAARLGAASVVEPPARLRAAVLDGIARTRQRPPVVTDGDGRPARRWRRWAIASVAAAAVVAGVIVAGPGQTPDPAQRYEAAVGSVLAAPDAVTVHGTGPGAGTRVVVSRARGEIVVLAAGLPALDPARVYQVWVIGPDGPRSAGLLAGQQAPPVLAAIPQEADRVGITAEPAGGSAHPTTPAVAMISLT
ncbi:anti-sigma factor domain-containing protein [Amycolatopsis sp. NPDC059021]|uniref:anti-sigma factor n=1 Tax=Amycolatopsis sp. NPDC059021 TaxID=3346704 RepID=UPI00366C0BD8